MRFLLGLFLMMSMNAFAGYQCEVSLSHGENLNQVLASRTVSASVKDLRSEMIDNFYISSSEGSSLVLKVFIAGWSGEEEMSAIVYSKQNNKLKPISEKVSLRGNEKSLLWFDSYKLKVSCSLA